MESCACRCVVTSGMIEYVQEAFEENPNVFGLCLQRYPGSQVRAFIHFAVVGSCGCCSQCRVLGVSCSIVSAVNCFCSSLPTDFRKNAFVLFELVFVSVPF